MKPINTNCNTCENLNCLIKRNLSSEKMQDLISAKNIIICKKGQQFISEGAPVSGLYFVLKGKAKVLKTGINGKEQILRFVDEGEIIGHRGFGVSQTHSVGAIAIEESVLCNFTIDTLKEMFSRIPEFTYDLMLFYSEELNRSETKIKSLAQMTVREKVIDTLLYINRKFGVNAKGYLDLQVSRREIADFAGTTNEQVIRTLSSLKQEDFIELKGKKIRINNVDLLKKEISEHNFFLNS
ncbi:MAG: Crp/Fnr family transcriptional regulator [Lutibacter sp.]|nr:Crp/Fnr family transcriptional regulator [Lutibacter sp.]MBP9600706.1 Crp/Fnr family transcriptional regulator [Lutibacter sp.]